MINQFELVVLEVAVKVERKHFTKKAQTDQRQTRKTHLGFPQTHSTSPWPADDLGGAVVVRLGFSQRSQRESELSGRVQMRPENELLSEKTTNLSLLVCACNKTSSWISSVP